MDEALSRGIVSPTLLDIYKNSHRVAEERVMLKWIRPIFVATLIFLIFSFTRESHQQMVFANVANLIAMGFWVRYTSYFDFSETGRFLSRCSRLHTMLGANNFSTGRADKVSLDRVALEFLEKQIESYVHYEVHHPGDTDGSMDRSDRIREIRILFILFGLDAQRSISEYESEIRKTIEPRVLKFPTRKLGSIRRPKI